MTDAIVTQQRTKLLNKKIAFVPVLFAVSEHWRTENIVERSISDNQKLYFIIYRSSFGSQKIRPSTGPRCIMGLR